MTANTFPQFNRFPLEIRTMIWELSTHEPRIVHLYQQYTRIDKSVYSEVRSDGQASAPMSPLQGYQYVSMSMGAESRMARALRTVGYTIEMWLEQNEGEWVRQERPRIQQGRGMRRYMPTIPGADPGDMGGEESFYIARYEDGTAEVEWINASTSVPKPPTGFKQVAPVPAQLLACRESHAVASTIYDKVFPTIGCPAEVYFNFKRDILHIDKHSFIRKIEWGEEDTWVLEFKATTSLDLRRVQNISVAFPDSAESFEMERFVCALLGTFGNIKRLTIASVPSSDKLPAMKMSQPNLIMRDNSKHEWRYGSMLFDDPGHLSRRHIDRDRLSWNKKINRRRRDYKYPEMTTWEMPEIDYQLLMTTEIEMAVEELRRDPFDDSDSEGGDRFDSAYHSYMDFSDVGGSSYDGSSAESGDGFENDSDSEEDGEDDAF